MATFVAKNSGGVKKEANDNLKRVFFFLVLVLVSSSGASDWQACEDSHWNMRTTFVFHKNCNSQSLNLKTIRRFIKNITSSHALEVYKYSKAFSVVAWDWGQNRSLRFVSCVFSVWNNRNGRRLTKLQVNTKNQITPKQLILATDFQWTKIWIEKPKVTHSVALVMAFLAAENENRQLQDLPQADFGCVPERFLLLVRPSQ